MSYINMQFVNRINYKSGVHVQMNNQIFDRQTANNQIQKPLNGLRLTPIVYSCVNSPHAVTQTSSSYYTVIGALLYCAVWASHSEYQWSHYCTYTVEYSMDWDQLQCMITTMRQQCHIECAAFTAIQGACFVQVLIVTMKRMKKKSSRSVSKQN